MEIFSTAFQVLVVLYCIPAAVIGLILTYTCFFIIASYQQEEEPYTFQDMLSYSIWNEFTRNWHKDHDLRGLFIGSAIFSASGLSGILLYVLS